MSSLAPIFVEQEDRLCVDAWYGYSHNFGCQKRNHPNIIEGAGLEDFETTERVFSASNAVALLTRYASPYNRQVYITIHFQQWDEEKRRNCANMLYNNYRQSLDILSTEGLALEHAKSALGLTDAMLEEYIDEEKIYIASIQVEPPASVHAMMYVELLRSYTEHKSTFETIASRFVTSTPEDWAARASNGRTGGYATDVARTLQLEKQEVKRRFAGERMETILREVIAMEVAMGITTRWTPETAEYLETLRYMTTRKYQRALDELRRLVVQRLFELQRLNISQTSKYVVY